MIAADAEGRRILVREHQAVLVQEAAQGPPSRSDAVPAVGGARRRALTISFLLALRLAGRRP
jgi:hypothetical protein